MSKLHTLAPVNVDFFKEARFKVAHSIVVDCPVERMMTALKSADEWVAWAGPMISADWTSSPVQQDVTRDVYLKGGILLKERFFHWEDNKRVCFCVDQASKPGLNKFAEDHQLTEINPNQTGLTLTVAFESKGIGMLLAPLIYLGLKLMLPKMVRGYKDLLEAP